MPIIQLPLRPCLRWIGPLLVIAAVLPVLGSRIMLPWRIAAATAIVVPGAVLWRRHLRRRPVGLISRPGGGLTCVLADGRELPVIAVRRGVIRPWLVSVRLDGGRAGSCDLFVPACGLAAHAHWQLRRALVGFRPPSGTARGGARPGTPDSFA